MQGSKTVFPHCTLLTMGPPNLNLVLKESPKFVSVMYAISNRFITISLKAIGGRSSLRIMQIVVVVVVKIRNSKKRKKISVNLEETARKISRD